MQKKFYIISFTIIFLCCSVFVYNNTYAKYKDKIKSDANMQIARWDIKINNETINNKKILSNKIEPIFDENEYIRENLLAPNASGYYDIVLDTTNCDVSVNYKITAINDALSTIEDLKIVNYEINPDNENSEKLTYENFIEGTISLNETITTVRIYIKWIDDETETMDNEEDTNAIISENAKALISNTIELIQKK